MSALLIAAGVLMAPVVWLLRVRKSNPDNEGRME